MKIGILTFHCAHNFGAVLQAYASQKYLESQGYDVEIIDYAPKYMSSLYKPIPKLKLTEPTIIGRIIEFVKYCIFLIPTFVVKSKRTQLFNNFAKKYLNFSKEKYVSSFKSNKTYDLYVIGSDQVWSPKHTNGLDPIYWGEFETKPNARKITYAASSSFYDFSEVQKQKISKWLTGLDHILVREDELQKYLQDHFAVPSQVVLDPTLLADRKVFDDIAIKPKRTRYLLQYAITTKETSYVVNEVSKRIAQERGLEIIALNLTPIGLIKGLGPYSPEEFLGLIKFADYVVCSSFHGLAFSLIFNKTFCSVGAGDNSDSRVRSLLTRLGIVDRLIFEPDQCRKLKSNIDYATINREMMMLQTTTRDILNDAISAK